MRNHSVINSVLLGVVIVGLFAFIGIVWAAFSTSLNINGAATVEKQGWDVHFANLSSVSLGGSASETVAPTIDGKTTTIGDYKLKFVTPGDSGTYTFDVVNAGTFGAKLSTITNTTFICTDSDGSTTSDSAQNVCKNLNYSLTYTSTGAEVSENDTLKANDSVNLTLKVTYDANTPVAELPTLNVEVSNLKSTLVYTQDNSVLVTTGKN